MQLLSWIWEELLWPPWYTTSVLSRPHQRRSGSRQRVHRGCNRATTYRLQACSECPSWSLVHGKTCSEYMCRTGLSHKYLSRNQSLWCHSYCSFEAKYFQVSYHSARCSTLSCNVVRQVSEWQTYVPALLIHLKNCSFWWTRKGSWIASRKTESSVCGTQVSLRCERYFSYLPDRLPSTSPRCQLQWVPTYIGVSYFLVS